MLKIAQIGVGYWGPNLLRNIVAHKKCVVFKVADISSERRDYVKRLYPSIEVIADADHIFHDPHIDAVVIATPVGTHFDLTIRAVKANKHVLVEKPMAITIEEVEAIGKMANQKNKVVMAGHTFLYNYAVRYVKKLIDSGELGDIRYIYSQRLNLGRIRSDVDALWNFAPHDISIIQYWLNNQEPIEVTLNGMDYVQNGINDVVFMNIKYPNKVMANIHVSWLDPQKIRRITAVGSKKMVVYDDMAEHKIILYDKGIDQMAILGEKMDFDNFNALNYNHRSGDVLLPKIEWQEPLKVQIEHFIDCIQNGTKCLTGVEHAKQVVNILSLCSKLNR